MIHMKKAILIIVIISMPYLLNAQFDSHSAGIRGGVNWSSLRSSPTINQPSWPLQYHVGLQYRMITGKYCGFIVETNYNQIGFKSNTDGITSTRNLSYVQIPFLTHINFGQKLFRFFIELGPYISFMVKDNKENGAASIEHTLPINNWFDYGISAGMGFEFNTKYGIYIIDGRFDFGFGNIFPATGGSDFAISSNLVAGVSIGYLFPITHIKRSTKR